ncbi:MAG: hypothetical protein JXL81_02160 [Deltaproteobacteria bacterium]|nr:hypothetical protein [Deltaproteobacteria bacterium]
MEITGAYLNYLNMSSLLTPLGAPGSSNYVTRVFTSSIAELQEKIDYQILSRESSAALSELYCHISSIYQHADRLITTETSSVFNDRTAQSSDSSVLIASAWDSYSPGTGATEAVYNISVSQLAQAQKNISEALTASDESVVDGGVNVFSFTIDEQDYELTITVAADATNGDVLYEISRVINQKVPGVAAEITENGGALNLTLTSDSTGAKAAFTVSDISGNAVAATGLDNVLLEARDAVCTVDGENLTSTANSLYLDNGAVRVSLYGTGDVTLEVRRDETAVYNAVTSLVSGINSFVEFYNENSNYLREDLLASLNNIIADQERNLESIGISVTNEGILQIDESSLVYAINQGPSAVEDIFASFDGLAKGISSFTSKAASESPLSYAREADSLSTRLTDFIYNSSAMQLKQLLAGTLLSVYV